MATVGFFISLLLMATTRKGWPAGSDFGSLSTAPQLEATDTINSEEYPL